MELKNIAAGVLDVAYEEWGPSVGDPVFLLPGFPYDVRAYAEVAPRLAEFGCRVIVPYLRGYGPTRYLSPDTPRSGEQAVLGNDLRLFSVDIIWERHSVRGSRCITPLGK